MKVLSIATNDVLGGAARAAYRLHTGLRAAGVDASMLVRWRHSGDPTVVAVGDLADEESLVRERELRRRWVRDNRTDRTDTLFSLPLSELAIVEHPLVRAADVIHLHWVANFLGPERFAALARLGIPIVWTLHDEWGYTGGCHYAAGCERFRSGCAECPQLREDPLRLVERLAVARRAAWTASGLVVVGPSRWIAERAAASAILGGCAVERIPYGLDERLFRPSTESERADVRAELGLPIDAFVVAFGVDRIAEGRKGAADLEHALAALPRDATLLRFGDATGAPPSKHRTIDLGVVRDDALLARAYGAADCFVLPSLEDNLPNGVLESMACGTPVVGYATGGIPDMVAEEVTGFLAPTGDRTALSQALRRAYDARSRLRAMGAAARERIEREHTEAVQASRYLRLYESLLRREAVA